MNDQRNSGLGLSRRELLTRAGTTAAGIGVAAVGGSVAPVAARNREQSLARSGGASGGKIMASSAVAPVDDLSERAVRSLEDRLFGEVIRPGNAEYDQARRVWNAAVDRRPALIVRPLQTADVIQAVDFARTNGLPLAVRGGGHSPAGYGTVDGGLVIDLSRMKRLDVDPERRVAWARPGLTWGDYDARVHGYGLATPGVDVAVVGIAGATLGGGMNWLMRKHGLTIDNLLEVEVVTADGQVVTANETEHPDLFWALRGGGGNFGVATGFRYRLHPVGTVLGGAIVYPATREGLRAYADAVAAAPDELTTITFVAKAPPLPFIPAEAHGTPVHLILPCYTGDLESGRRALAPFQALAGRTPLADTTGPTPYPNLIKVTEMAAVSRPHSIRNAYLRELADETIEIILDAVNGVTSPYGLVALRELGGAVARVPVDATAFAHRDKAFYLAGDNSWKKDDPEPERHVAWTEAFWRAVAPSTDGAYASYMDDEGEERVRAAYPPATYDRLAAIKRRYDPSNLFRVNPNIRPD
jgi:FAD/FMN-containing dehydrogenase